MGVVPLPATSLLFAIPASPFDRKSLRGIRNTVRLDRVPFFHPFYKRVFIVIVLISIIDKKTGGKGLIIGAPTRRFFCRLARFAHPSLRRSCP
jgi:hypothetical protein